MSTLSSIRFAPVVSQNARPSNSNEITAEKKAPQTPAGFSGESRFDAEPTANSAKPAASSGTEQKALKEMDKVLKPAEKWNRQGTDSTVTADAPDVEQLMKDPSAQREAAAQVKANAAAEKKRLASMSKKEQAQYKAVKDAFHKDSNAVGELALQKLLFQGKLNGGKDLVGQGTTLDHLASVAKGDNLHKDVSKKTLLNDLVQELATPSAINQGPRKTCAPTAMSIDLAMNHPAEYARIAAGLASPEGKVKLADGKTTLQRAPETSFAKDGTGRALTQRLLAPVFMEIANGSKEYNDRTGSGGGAYARDLDTLQDKIYGRNMAYKDLSTAKDRASAMDRIDRELASGQNVLAGIRWQSGGHEVLVTGSDDKYVKFINPWGTEEKMPREDFEKRLLNINYDPQGASKKSTPAVPKVPDVPVDPVTPSRPQVKPEPSVPPSPWVKHTPDNPEELPFDLNIGNWRFAIITG